MVDRGSAGEVQVLDSTYTAVIIVARSRTKRTADGGGYFNSPPETSSGEMANIKIHATSLTNLALKIKQHTDLLEDE